MAFVFNYYAVTGELLQGKVGVCLYDSVHFSLLLHLSLVAWIMPLLLFILHYLLFVSLIFWIL